MNSKLFTSTIIAVAFSIVAIGCGKSADDDHSAEGDTDAMENTEMAAGPDTSGASVWSHIQEANYQGSWTSWPDKGSLYTGQQPHGALLTTYLNEAAAEALAAKAGTMPEGAIIVKENYMPDESLAAVTVMYKVKGYNPGEGDWFYSKHNPDGTLAMAADMALEGRVAGCVGCHRAKSANDFIYTSSLSE
jgi:hypothetical protein